MAFVTSTPLLVRQTTPATSTPLSRRSPFATAATPPPASAPNSQRQSTTKPHKKAAAHVIDSTIATRIEAHHWILVKTPGARLFEHAAVAQADTARQVDARTHSGALHRWVLKETEDPTQIFLNPELPHHETLYVVMEAFSRDEPSFENQLVMRRWLSAVERVGPLVDAVDIQTLHYENMFTSKVHNVQFDPHHNIVVMESINVDTAKDKAMERVVAALERTAETSVSAGECLEFCVLHAPNEHGFFKTIEIYRDVEALMSHMNATDVATSEEIKPYLIQGNRRRQTFKPIIFT